MDAHAPAAERQREAAGADAEFQGLLWVAASPAAPRKTSSHFQVPAARILKETMPDELVVAQEVGPSAGVVVKADVGEGSAAQLLLDAARDAFLVVVGSRGHGGIAGTLLGSVSQSMAQHSPCPVLIIRGVE